MTLKKLHLVGSVAALCVGLLVFASPSYAQTTRQAAGDGSIRPFSVRVPQA